MQSIDISTFRFSDRAHYSYISAEMYPRLQMIKKGTQLAHDLQDYFIRTEAIIRFLFFCDATR